jgi:hypothetical protein
MDHCKPNERETLERRYIQERAADQERIGNLLQDYKFMKAKIEAGEIPKFTQRETCQSDDLFNKPKLKRFSGLEYNGDVVSQRTRCIDSSFKSVVIIFLSIGVIVDLL